AVGALEGLPAEHAAGDLHGAATRRPECSGGGERGPAGEGGQADEVIGDRDRVAGHPGALRAAVARAPEAPDRLHPAGALLDGLIANDKFCLSRRTTVRLTWWRRALSRR